MIEPSLAPLALVGPGLEADWPSVSALVAGLVGLAGAVLAVAAWRGYLSSGLGRGERRRIARAGRSPRRTPFWPTSW